MLKAGWLKKTAAFFTLAAFMLTNAGPACAQMPFYLPAPGTRAALSPSFSSPVLKGIRVYRNDPFRLDFILDKGDLREQRAWSRELVEGPDSRKDPAMLHAPGSMLPALTAESTRLIKYFLASLTVPEKDLWVNLSPYEKDRIVPEAFGQTEMGRDLLAQDYLLKQITASVLYPEGETGKEFWKKVYAEAQKRYGSTDIPVDTFNKVWIVPEKATVYENKEAAFVVESKLKVMLDSDYLAATRSRQHPTTCHLRPMTSASAEIAKDVLREIIIPVLEKEVNEGANFAPLRQVYHSLILATWYKRKVKESLLAKGYVDKAKTAGVDIEDKDEKEKIWLRYVEAFKKGAYNLVREETDPVTRETIPRKYFSGGVGMNQIDAAMLFVQDGTLAGILPGHALVVQTALSPWDSAMKSDGMDKDPFRILSTVQGRSLAAEWVRMYPNEGLDDQEGVISRVVEHLSDPSHHGPDIVSQTINRFPFLEEMHRRYKTKTQPNAGVPAYELPAVKGKVGLLGVYVQGPNLLNVGAGMSLFEERSLQYIPGVINAIGVDIEPQRKTPLAVPDGKTYEFRLMRDPSVIPVEEGWANTAVATFVFHHVEVDRLNYLKELRSKMADGGRLLVVEDTFSHILPVQADEFLSQSVQDIYMSFMDLPSDQERVDFLHFADWFVHNFVNRSRSPLVPGNYESMETWASLFRQAGFTVREMRNLGFSRLGSRNPVSRGMFVLEKVPAALRDEPGAASRDASQVSPRPRPAQIRRAAEDLSRQDANVVFERMDGRWLFRRGPVDLEIDDALSAWLGTVMQAQGRESLLLNLRQHSARDIEEAFHDTGSGMDLIQTLAARGIRSTDHPKRVLLVAPYGDMEGRKLKYKVPHKGVETIANLLLRQTEDTDALVYNPNLGGEEGLYRFVQTRHFDIIGFSILQTVLKKNLEIMGRLSQISPDSIFIAGGSELKKFPLDDVFASWPVDVLFLGRTSSLMDYVRSFAASAGREENTSAADKLPNVAFRTKDGWQKSVSRAREALEPQVDINADVPYDKPDLVHHDHYDQVDEKARQPVAFDRIGRNPFRVHLGDFCRGRCIFCGTTRNTQRDLPPQEVVSLAQRRAPDTDSLHFESADFLYDTASAAGISASLAAEPGLRLLPKMAIARVDEVSDGRILHLMRQAGFQIVAFGIESFDDQVLKGIGKETTTEENDAALQLAIQEGIKPGLNLIMLTPWDTVDTTLKLISRSLHYMERGAYINVVPYLFVGYGRKISGMKEIIGYETYDFPGMRAPFRFPRLNRILDEELSGLRDEVYERLFQLQTHNNYPHWAERSVSVYSLLIFKAFIEVLRERGIKRPVDYEDYLHKIDEAISRVLAAEESTLREPQEPEATGVTETRFNPFDHSLYTALLKTEDGRYVLLRQNDSTLEFDDNGLPTRVIYDIYLVSDSGHETYRGHASLVLGETGRYEITMRMDRGDVFVHRVVSRFCELALGDPGVLVDRNADFQKNGPGFVAHFHRLPSEPLFGDDIPRLLLEESPIVLNRQAEAAEAEGYSVLAESLRHLASMPGPRELPPQGRDRPQEIGPSLAVTQLDLTRFPQDPDAPAVMAELGRLALRYRPAAVSVYARHLKYLPVEALKEAGVHIGVVAAFPEGLGHADIPAELESLEAAVKNGADEVDVVMDIGAIRSGNPTEAEKSLARFALGVEAIKNRLKRPVRIKTILETAALENDTAIRLASRLALKYSDTLKMVSGFPVADDGGKRGRGALDAARIMLEEILFYFQKTGILRGMKITGGIRDWDNGDSPDTSVARYYALVREVLGEQLGRYYLLGQDFFRIGGYDSLTHFLEAAYAELSGLSHVMALDEDIYQRHLSVDFTGLSFDPGPYLASKIPERMTFDLAQGEKEIEIHRGPALLSALYIGGLEARGVKVEELSLPSAVPPHHRFYRVEEDGKTRFVVTGVLGPSRELFLVQALSGYYHVPLENIRIRDFGVKDLRPWLGHALGRYAGKIRKVVLQHEIASYAAMLEKEGLAEPLEHLGGDYADALVVRLRSGEEVLLFEMQFANGFQAASVVDYLTAPVSEGGLGASDVTLHGASGVVAPGVRINDLVLFSGIDWDGRGEEGLPDNDVDAQRLRGLLPEDVGLHHLPAYDIPTVLNGSIGLMRRVESEGGGIVELELVHAARVAARRPGVRFRAFYEVHDKPALHTGGGVDTLQADVPAFRDPEKRYRTWVALGQYLFAAPQADEADLFPSAEKGTESPAVFTPEVGRHASRVTRNNFSYGRNNVVFLGTGEGAAYFVQLQEAWDDPGRELFYWDAREHLLTARQQSHFLEMLPFGEDSVYKYAIFIDHIDDILRDPALRGQLEESLRYERDIRIIGYMAARGLPLAQKVMAGSQNLLSRINFELTRESVRGIRDKKVVVLGATGLVGRAVTDELKARGFTDVSGVSRSGSVEDGVRSADLSDPEILAREIGGADIVINAAVDLDFPGMESGGAARARARAVNVGIPQAAAAAGFSGKFVQLSTFYVFGHSEGLALPEDATDPISEYGRQKLEAEKVAAGMSDASIVRLGPLIGYDERGKQKGFYLNVLRHLDTLRSGGDVQPVKAPTYPVSPIFSVAETAAAVVSLIEHDHRGLAQVSGREPLSTVDQVRVMAQVYNEIHGTQISPVIDIDERTRSGSLTPDVRMMSVISPFARDAFREIISQARSFDPAMLFDEENDLPDELIARREALREEEILAFEEELPGWDWRRASEVPWRELVRNPDYHQPGGPTDRESVVANWGSPENQGNYWNNNVLVRRHFLFLVREMMHDPQMRLADFTSRLDEMHVALRKGKGDSLYKSDGGVDEATLTGVQNHNPRYLEQVLLKLKTALNQDKSTGALLRKVVLIVDFYIYLLNDVEDLLFGFGRGNNSAFMNMVNGLLRLEGLNGVPHDYLDSHITYIHKPNIEILDEFLELLRANNPGNKDVQGFSMASITPEIIGDLPGWTMPTGGDDASQAAGAIQPDKGAGPEMAKRDIDRMVEEAREPVLVEMLGAMEGVIRDRGLETLEGSRVYLYISLLKKLKARAAEVSELLSPAFKNRLRTLYAVKGDGGVSYSDIARLVLASDVQGKELFAGWNTRGAVMQGSPRILLVAGLDGAEHKKGMFLAPPLGLYQIRSFMRQFGFDVVVHDPNLDGVDALERLVSNETFDIIGFSANHVGLERNMRTMQKLRELSPRSLVVVGNQEASFAPEYFLDSGVAEIAVKGVGEFPLLDIAAGFVPGAQPRAAYGRIPGLFFPGEDGPVFTGDVVPVIQPEFRALMLGHDFRHTPYERYWEFMAGMYTPEEMRLLNSERGIKGVRIIAANYCPIGCTFCSTTNFFNDMVGGRHPVLFLDAADIGLMIERVLEAHPDTRTIYFNDDNFFIRPSRVKELIGIIRERFLRYDLDYLTQGRSDSVNPELLAAAAGVGFKKIFYGIEHFSSGVLESMEKGTSVKDNIRAVIDTVQAGITPIVNILLWYPTVREDDLEVTINDTSILLEQGAILGLNATVMALPGAKVVEKGHDIRTREFDLQGGAHVSVPDEVELDSTAMRNLAQRAKGRVPLVEEEVRRRYDLSGKIPYQAAHLMYFRAILLEMGRPTTYVDRALERFLERAAGKESRRPVTHHAIAALESDGRPGDIVDIGGHYFNIAQMPAGDGLSRMLAWDMVRGREVMLDLNVSAEGPPAVGDEGNGGAPVLLTDQQGRRMMVRDAGSGQWSPVDAERGGRAAALPPAGADMAQRAGLPPAEPVSGQPSELLMLKDRIAHQDHEQLARVLPLMKKVKERLAERWGEEMTSYTSRRLEAAEVVVADGVPFSASIYYRPFASSLVPVLLLDAEFVRRSTEAQIGYVLGHELGHLLLEHVDEAVLRVQDPGVAGALLRGVEDRADVAGVMMAVELFSPQDVVGLEDVYRIFDDLRQQQSVVAQEWGIENDPRLEGVHRPSPERGARLARFIGTFYRLISAQARGLFMKLAWKAPWPREARAAILDSLIVQGERLIVSLATPGAFPVAGLQEAFSLDFAQVLSLRGGVDLSGLYLDDGAAGGQNEVFFDPAAMGALLRASGLRPVILGIRPLEDLSGFLSFK
jgi:magnesium-protoporphyrin IX monomethyl ester (oxidative) cyclase